jgi:hypothetical protein
MNADLVAGSRGGVRSAAVGCQVVPNGQSAAALGVGQLVHTAIVAGFAEFPSSAGMVKR